MLCYNYDSGRYEDIDEDGYSWDQGKYVHCWDDSPYEDEREEERRREEEEEEEERRRRKRRHR